MIQMNCAISGEYEAHTRKVVGNKRGRWRKRAEGKNLITNVGMDGLGTGSLSAWLNAIQVGTSATTPTNSDTTLNARVAGAVRDGNTATSWDGNTLVITITATFGVGVATGVLAELGVANAGTGNVNTHALFQSGGVPITVTVLADEQLLVTYRLRITPTLSTDTQVYNRKGVDYTLTLRPAGVGTAAGSAPSSTNTARLGPFADSGTGSTVTGLMYRSGTGVGAYDGAPDGTTSSITRTLAGAIMWGTYTPGSYTRTDELRLPTGSLNNTGYTAAMFYGPIRAQIGISPALTKTSLDLLGFIITTTWARG